MSELVEKEVCRTIEKLLDEYNITNYEIDIKPGSVTGDNYLGVISSVTVCGLDKTGDKKEFNFIVKSSQKDEEFRKLLNVHDIFEREILVYTYILPLFEQFQKERRVKNPFRSYAKLYKHTLEDASESLIMENMKELGYQLRNRLEPLDYYHTSIVLKEYGRLHALSFALKDQNPKVFEKLFNRCQETFFHSMDNDEMNESLQMSFERAIQVLDTQVDSCIIKKFNVYSGNILKKLLDVLSSETSGQYAVIVHGDCWINNILYKYNNSEKPNVPTDICVLDWQLSCAGSPALDLSYFLFTSTDKKLRDQYFDIFLEQYYDSFSFFLNELGSSAEKLFPWEVFQNHMKQFSFYGLMMSLMVTKLMLTDKEEACDFSKMTQEERIQSSKSEFKNSKIYDERIHGILEDFYKLGYL